jgi:hypothetical protein
MRQMAGTVPPEGKNNWYVTHGFNMKGAFGEQVDEGYWMCLKPDESLAFPKVKGSHVVTHEICQTGAGEKVASVDFSSTKQFGTEFLLSSESLYLMDKCSALAAASSPIFQKAALNEPALELTASEANSTNAFDKLLEIQAHALTAVPHAHGINTTTFHLGLFVHNNGGYRYPDTVHTPFRRIVEDTISDADLAARFAIADAILAAGDHANYACSNATTSFPLVKAAIEECYVSQYNTGQGWYWGGEDKASINSAAGDFVGDQLYGSVAKWKGGRKWFVEGYVSGYVAAGTCLVENGDITLSTLIDNMGGGSCDGVAVTKALDGVDGSAVAIGSATDTTEADASSDATRPATVAKSLSFLGVVLLSALVSFVY